jgi:hypothetical protein
MVVLLISCASRQTLFGADDLSLRPLCCEWSRSRWWVSESAKPVEIVVNDQYCTKILLDCAAPLFPAEIVSGSSWVVRLRPPAGGRWVPELLSLVERWLEAARLPCAKVLYDGRSYLIRTSPDITQSSTLTDITSVTMVSGSTLLN